MTWVVFTPTEFATWHDARCTALTIKSKTYYAANLPDTEDLTGLRVLDSLTVDPTTGAITVIYQGQSYSATPSGVNVAKPKPQSIVIDGATYTRSA